MQLGVISIAVKVDAMSANDLSQGKHIEREEQRSKHRPLEYSISNPRVKS